MNKMPVFQDDEGWARDFDQENMPWFQTDLTHATVCWKYTYPNTMEWVTSSGAPLPEGTRVVMRPIAVEDLFDMIATLHPDLPPVHFFDHALGLITEELLQDYGDDDGALEIPDVSYLSYIDGGEGEKLCWVQNQSDFNAWLEEGNTDPNSTPATTPAAHDTNPLAQTAPPPPPAPPKKAPLYVEGEDRREMMSKAKEVDIEGGLISYLTKVKVADLLKAHDAGDAAGIQAVVEWAEAKKAQKEAEAAAKLAAQEEAAAKLAAQEAVARDQEADLAAQLEQKRKVEATPTTPAQVEAAPPLPAPPDFGGTTVTTEKGPAPRKRRKPAAPPAQDDGFSNPTGAPPAANGFGILPTSMVELVSLARNEGITWLMDLEDLPSDLPAAEYNLLSLVWGMPTRDMVAEALASQAEREGIEDIDVYVDRMIHGGTFHGKTFPGILQVFEHLGYIEVA